MDNLGYGASCIAPHVVHDPHKNDSISALEQSKGISSEIKPVSYTGVIDIPSILRIPGWDEKGDLCGEVIAVETCPDHPENVKFISHRCFDPKCEFCYGSWIGREIKSANDRLLEAETLYAKQGFNLGNIKHITISPQQTDDVKEQIKTIEGIRKLRTDCKDYLIRLGSLGGLIIFHAWRVKKFYQRKFAIYKKRGGEGALWDWIRAKDLLNEAVYVSPHFHCLQYGYLKDSDLAQEDFLNNKRINRFNGWIYKNIEPDVEGGRDIKRTVAYQLNHSTLTYSNIYEKRPIHAVTWFGLLSYNKVGKDKEKSRVDYIYPECEICQKPIHKFVDKEHDDIYVPEHLRENPENLFIFCNLHDLGEVKRKMVICVFNIKRGSWYYRWRKKKRKVKEDGTVIHDGMVKVYFTPK